MKAPAVSPPTRAVLNFTHKCALACEWCYVPFGTPAAERDVVKRIVDRLSFFGFLQLTLGGGDPFQYSFLPEIGIAARKAGLFVQIDTHGKSMVPNHCKRLAIPSCPAAASQAALCPLIKLRGHMDTTLSLPPARRTRRRHSPEFRASVIRAASQPGISIAAVALANGLNANMLRKWVAEAQAVDPPGARSHAKALATTAAPVASPAFVPLTLAAPSPAAPGADIRLEVRRGATSVNITWPACAAEACAQWLRELLR